MIKEPKVFLSHIGYLCEARKRVVCVDGDYDHFEVQDMGLCANDALGAYENWQCVFKGPLKREVSHMGTFRTGDFSALVKPGVYRVVLPDIQGHSFQFIIADGVYHLMPKFFFDYIHCRRSGNFEDDLRACSHMDDGVRSDNGKLHDAVGGWYDAGDLRKWMVHSHLPAFAFMEIYEKGFFKRNYLAAEKVSDSDWLTESAWAVNFILKMQDDETGMFFEDLGGGDTEKRSFPGMSWWYENHAGCCGSNSDNRFTDNKTGSGDERHIRVQYNPIVQYINIKILLLFARNIMPYQPELAEKCRSVAAKAWSFVEQKRHGDHMHGWTSVRAWRLEVVNELARDGVVGEDVLRDAIESLLMNFNDSVGFWFMDESRNDSYRGILHSAQPIIALCGTLELFPDFSDAGRVKSILSQCVEKYILPMSETNPFRVMPYGLYFNAPDGKDVYRQYSSDIKFRFYMPNHSPQRVNHGISGHYTNWSHALAFLGQILQSEKLYDLAWSQLYWLLGNNPLSCCAVSGFGYRNPMPHSRFHGTIPGGFCNMPRGTEKDEIFIDLDARAEWNSTEYWNYPVGNTLLAFTKLLPLEISSDKKLG